MGMANLLSVATAVPPYRIDQNEAAAGARLVFGDRYEEFERMVQVFETSGIRSRYAAKPLEWFIQPLGWPERNAAYLEAACELFVDSATQALQRAGLTGADIDTVVTVSSTGIATPSLEARVADRMGFRPGIERVPVFGLGCAGGVSGLSVAARLAQSRQGSNVLMVAVELCTPSFSIDDLTKANMVATALFGDGAAACVIRSGDGGGLAAIEATGQYTWPDTLDVMGWSVDAKGLGVIFDRAIPRFARNNMRAAVADILARDGDAIGDVDRFICHPGGTKVVEALEACLKLGKGALDHERAVLADYGNMSGPTVFFVLERALAQGLPQRSVLTAMGPGFTASCATLAAA
jgi:alkylresorcinol/alkylpyrone synthase